jgi:hypothetical protein
MTGWTRASFAIVAIAAGSGCSLFAPTEPLTGAWVEERTGPPSATRFQWNFLNLQQDGDDISGTACYLIAGSVRFRDAPVVGRYPYVSWVITETSVCDVPLCAGLLGSNWSGRVDGSGDIVAIDGGRRYVRTAAVPAACLNP